MIGELKMIYNFWILFLIVSPCVCRHVQGEGSRQHQQSRIYSGGVGGEDGLLVSATIF